MTKSAAPRKLNVKLLRKIQKYILAEPRRLNMVQWGAKFITDSVPSVNGVLAHVNNSGVRRFAVPITESDLPPCGTVGCIAGTAFILGAPKSEVNFLLDDNGSSYVALPSQVEDKARELLALSWAEAHRLFLIQKIHDIGESADHYWPEKFGKAYRKAKTPLTRAKIAVARIEHFIATKGAE